MMNQAFLCKKKNWLSFYFVIIRQKGRIYSIINEDRVFCFHGKDVINNNSQYFFSWHIWKGMYILYMTYNLLKHLNRQRLYHI